MAQLVIKCKTHDGGYVDNEAGVDVELASIDDETYDIDMAGCICSEKPEPAEGEDDPEDCVWDITFEP